MKRSRFTLLLLFIFAISQFSYAHLPPKANAAVNNQMQEASLRSQCSSANAQIDLKINNVRARLRTGGDFWWDSANAGYIVPVPEPGVPEVAAIYAGAIWTGGLDQGGNLKTACQTYGSAFGSNDFWPGPLSEVGETDSDNCANWDRFFSVSKTSVDELKANLALALSQNRTELNPDEIPDEIKGWPAVGNPFFEDIHGFALPTINSGFNGMGDFFDVGGVPGLFEPQFGDYPILSYNGCEDVPGIVPDQMIFSIINDGGGIHASSNGDAILMEIQTTSYAFKTTDEINDMTFYKYRMINRAIESIDSTYFGIWVDPDLGCYTDDLVGCDIDRGLAYIYNEDDLDGESSCTDCGQGVASYCTDIPVIGIDILRGPLDEFGNPLSMSSFTYHESGGTQTNNAMLDPEEAVEFYHYLTGRWRDGTPLTPAGAGYSPTSPDHVNYAFSSPPNDPNGWSMCSAGISGGDYRTVQAVGPMELKPGAVNEMTTGVIFTPSIEYPCPDLTRFFAADDKAQELFDNCFNSMVSSVAEPMDFDPVQIFPNPYSLSAGGSLHLQAVPTAASVSIYDITGRLLKSYQGAEQMQLDLSTDLDQPSPGTYVIQVRTKDHGTKAYKFVIMK